MERDSRKKESMMRAIAISLALTSSMPSHAASKGEANVEYRFKYSSEDGVYQFSLIDHPLKNRNVIDSNGGRDKRIRISDRSLVINCVDHCRCPGSYIERIGSGSGWPTGSGLIGIFLVEDESKHLVTTWSEATSYNANLYGCDNRKIKKVLSLNSRTVPQFHPDNNGMPVVSYSPDYDHPDVIATLRWDGSRYSRIAGTRIAGTGPKTPK